MNESDLRSDVHYLGSSENKAWKNDDVYRYFFNYKAITSRDSKYTMLSLEDSNKLSLPYYWWYIFGLLRPGKGQWFSFKDESLPWKLTKAFQKFPCLHNLCKQGNFFEHQNSPLRWYLSQLILKQAVKNIYQPNF